MQWCAMYKESYVSYVLSINYDQLVGIPSVLISRGYTLTIGM